MAKRNIGKYYIKNTSEGDFLDIATLFDGVAILAVEGMNGKGKALNVYYQQWITGGTDFYISSDGGKIIRENTDIKVVFIIGQRYAEFTIDAQSVYDEFIDYMTKTDVWIKSAYVSKEVHCVCINKFEPQMIKLHRGNDSYIMGTIELHTLDAPATSE